MSSDKPRASITLPAPPKFLPTENTCPYSAWRKWSSSFRRFATASGISTLTAPEQVSHLLILAGDQIAEIFDAHIIADISPTDGFEVVLTSIEAHFKKQLNTSQARFEFLNAKQEAKELDGFMQHLRDKVSECQFCKDCSQSLTTTVFINGVGDNKLRRHLISFDKLSTPEEMLSKAKSFVSTRKIEMQISAGGGERAAISAVPASVDQLSGRRAPNQDRRQRQFSHTGGSRRTPICQKGCYTHPNGRCRAPETKCNKCSRYGHFANVCRTVNAVVEHEPEPIDAAVDNLALDVLRILSLEGTRRHTDAQDTWWAKLAVGSPPHHINFKLDSGAECSVLPRQAFNSLRSPPALTPTQQRVVSYSNHALQIDGVCRLPVRAPCDGSIHLVKFYVIRTSAPPILGLPACTALQLIKRCGVDSAVCAPSEDRPADSEILSEFADVFDPKVLGCLNATQTISIPSPPPPKRFPPRRIPARFIDNIRKQLTNMVTLGVLERCTKPTRYVLPVVIVRKSDGSFRLCIDPRFINPHIQRMTFSMPKAEQLFANLSGAKVFTVVDAASAFYQLPLDEASSDLCTISTQFGNYRFKRLPFGIADASERFSEVMHRLFSDLDNVINCVDDFLIYGRTRTEHDESLRRFLSRCREVGLKLKPQKLQLAKPAVRFLGHNISGEGVQILEERVHAIKQMKPPSSPTEVRQFLGIINYVQKFVPNAAARTAPLRLLTRADPDDYRWGEAQQLAFEDLKATITRAPVLQHFDPNKQLTISTDASSFGMGAVLLQEGHPVAFTSASLTPTQQRYSQLEKELLAVVFACEQFRFYILGSHIDIESDHRPLESIVKKDIAVLSPRLQKMLLRLLRYSFSLRYVPGRFMFVADALSRAPTDHRFETPDMENPGEMVLAALSVSADRQARLVRATAEDAGTSVALELTRVGWPAHKHQVPPAAKPFWQHRHELHTADDLLFRGHRLVIPACEIPAVLSTLHAAHQGETLMLRQARASVYWPGLTASIRQAVDNCDQCLAYARANPREPLVPTPPAPYPWHSIAADFMHWKQKTFLVVVDYFSKDVVVKTVPSTSAAAVTAALNDVIIQHGVPACLISDNGPPFASREFLEYCRQWGIQLRPVSPEHPSANGQVERTIQTLKSVFNKAEASGQSITEALLALRNTPGVDGLSPALLSNGRVLRTRLPISQNILMQQPTSSWNVRRRTIENAGSSAKEHYDHATRDLPVLVAGQRVLVRRSCRNWENGVIVRPLENPRSYLVRLQSGLEIRRNRREIRNDPRAASPARPDGETTDATAPGATSLEGSEGQLLQVDWHPSPSATESQPPVRSSSRTARLNPRIFNSDFIS